MATPPLPDKDRKKRKQAVEEALKAGHAPPGTGVQRGTVGAMTKAGMALGYVRATMSTWLRVEENCARLGTKNFVPDWSLYQEEKTVELLELQAKPELSGTPESRRITALEDEVARLKRELRGVHREQMDEQAIRNLIGNLARAEPSLPKWLAKPSVKKTPKPEVGMTIWSDWHLGEKVSREETGGVNEYDEPISEARIKRLVQSTIDIARNHGPSVIPGFVVNLLGDNVSGGLHPELEKTDTEGVMASAIRAVDLLTWALTSMADEFGSVFCPCASGNHGRNTPKPEYKNYLEHNFDWLIYQILQRNFEAAGDTRVKFMIPKSNECRYEVYGRKFLALHGDMIGARGGDGIIGSIGPIMRGEFKTRNQSSATQWAYDFLLMGHYHQSLWLPRAIVNNSIKGYDEYVKNSLRASPSDPSQSMWFVHPDRGITSKWEVSVNDPGEIKKAEWVTWEAAA